MYLIVSIAILVAGGPLLALPDLVPEAWRTGVTLTVAIAALCAATVTLRPIVPLRVPVGLFAGIVALNAVLHAGGPLVGLRHTAGVALGVLAMAVIGLAANTHTRLRLAGFAIAFGGLAVVVAGATSTYFGWDGQKLVLGSTSEQQKLLYPWLPQAQLPLPGLESDGGWVNANALGGTALMVLPFLVGLAAAGRYLSGSSRMLAWVLGGVGAAATLSVIWMSRSRTALIATLLLSVFVASQRRSLRRVVAAGLVLLIIAFAVSLNTRRQAAPGLFENGITSTVGNLRTRVTYWRAAVTTLSAHPLIGVGISQFHEGPPDANGERPYIAHAHNMFLQVALDVGLLGLLAYLWMFGWVTTAARRGLSGSTRALAAGAALSIVAAHLFGLTDAIALGAKVGLFQWLCAGLLIAAWHHTRHTPHHTS